MNQDVDGSFLLKRRWKQLRANIARACLSLLAACAGYLITFGPATDANAAISAINVVPSSPMDTDVVVIEVSGYFPDACRGIDSISFE